MSLNALLNTARDALQAQTYGVSVTSQNINNANTPGYVRREAILETRIFGRETYGSVGIQGLSRSTDRFLEARHFSAVGMSSSSQTRDFQLAKLEAVFGDLGQTGVSDALAKIQDAFTKVSANPSDQAARQAVLDSLEGFSNRVRDAANYIAQQRSDTLTEMQSVVGDVNQRAGEIASLNREIIQAEAQGKDAADLKDKRNQVLLGLAPLVDLNVVEGADGGILVQAAGATLVEGATSRLLSVSLGTNGEARIRVQRSDGASATDITNGLSGGKLAGLKEVRDVDLAQVAAQLDRFAYQVGSALNAQHAAGFGLDGSTGTQLFSFTTPGVPPEGAARGMTVNAALTTNNIAASSTSGGVPGNSTNALSMLSVFENPITGLGNRTATEAYGDIVGDVGLRRQSATRELAVRDAMEQQASQMRESVSGVSLDEEMVNLTKYQRAYQAASRVLTTADELLQELLSIKR